MDGRKQTMPRFAKFSLTILAGVACAAIAAAAPSVAAEDEANNASPVYVRMTTSMGDIYLELNREKAPITVENFVQYVNDRFYDGTLFHRVIPTFMIQGGGFTEAMQQKPTRDPIKNEWENGLSNDRGTIAMARTSDPDSATAQFFINVANNAQLSQASPMTGGAGYAVFGKVVHGMDVVDQIRRVPTTARSGHQNVPREPVIIESMRVISHDELERAKGDEKEDEGDEARPAVSPTEDGRRSRRQLEPAPDEPIAHPGESTARDREPSPNPAADGFNHEDSDQRAIELADEVMEALGGRRAWDETRHLTWMFFNTRRHVWNKASGDVRIEYVDRDTQEHVVILMNLNTKRGVAFRNRKQVTDETDRDKLLDLAERYWINDSYWLFMPYKLKDSGVTLKYLGMRETLGGHDAEVIELTFEKVGRTPQNKYHVYVDPDSKLVVQWDFFSDAANTTPDFQTPWRNWKRYGRIMLSDDRGEGRKLQDLGVALFLPNTTYADERPVDWRRFTRAAE